MTVVRSNTTSGVKAMMVSRGHGRGHAMPDISIAEAVLEVDPATEWTFVSYAAGAQAYRTHGYSVIDMGVSENPASWDMVIRFMKMLLRNPPDLVVAHEETGVIAVAAALEIPCLFITDFFVDPGHPFMQALRYTTEVIFSAQAGLFTEPPYLHHKIRYVGRAVRRMKHSREERNILRREIGIPSDALVIVCQPGSWSEAQVPLIDLLPNAFELITHGPKRLIWVAGREYEFVKRMLGHADGVTILKEEPRLDRLLAASDVLITKANRMTVYEAAALGLPSISISCLVNWPDDVAVASVESNVALQRAAVTPEVLCKTIMESAVSTVAPAADISRGVTGAATRIVEYIQMLRSSRRKGRSVMRSVYGNHG